MKAGSNLPGDRWYHLWPRVAHDPFFLAGAWTATGRSLAALAGALGTDEATAIRVGVCRAPRPGEDRAAWTARVSARFGLDAERVAGALVVLG